MAQLTFETWTECELGLRNALRAYISSSALTTVSVTHPDQSSITYRSVDEIRRALQWVATMASQERQSGRRLFLGVVPSE
jgi:hypothetical protein